MEGKVMKVGQQFLYAVLTAVLAGVVTLATQAMAGWPVYGVDLSMAGARAMTFISFGTWACYFAAGANVKGALNWLYSMIVGIIAAIFMFALTYAWFGAMGYLGAVSVAVIVVVFFMMWYDKIKINGAGLFIGTAFYFALAGCGVFGALTDGIPGFKEYMIVAFAEIVYTIIGLCAGWLTIFFAVNCSKIGAKKA
jgi:uncharacterized membrane protein YuzA (DUF378 family)